MEPSEVQVPMGTEEEPPRVGNKGGEPNSPGKTEDQAKTGKLEPLEKAFQHLAERFQEASPQVNASGLLALSTSSDPPFLWGPLAVQRMGRNWQKFRFFVIQGKMDRNPEGGAPKGSLKK